MISPELPKMTPLSFHAFKLVSLVLTRTQAFSTNVLIIGGAYAGLSALVAMKNHLKERNQLQKVSVTLVEPKSGFLNILGMPRAIVDTEFAKTQFVPFENLQDIQFDRILSDDELALASLGNAVKPDNNAYVDITYVQGSVTELKPNSAEYKLNNSTSTDTVDFDYVVVATGRNRPWPTSPVAHNFASYLKEMEQFKENIESCRKIGVIGGGAVGIEIAGDIKTKYKDKEVTLVHPHAQFPPEPLKDEFKTAVRDSLERAGVKILTGYRVKSEGANHELQFTNGETMESDFNYWCTSFKNNTLLFSGELAPFVSPKNNIYVNDYLQLTHPETQHHIPNVFAVGDLCEFEIIKSAGWALYHGRQVANNVVSLIFDGKVVEPMPDITKMPRGMVLVGGNNEIVSVLDGVVEFNNAHYVAEYEDYCIGKVRATLGA